MSTINLNFLCEGRPARVVGIENSQDQNEKVLKYLSGFGIAKGNIIEVVSKQVAGLMVLKMNNSTFGISNKIADYITVKSL